MLHVSHVHKLCLEEMEEMDRRMEQIVNDVLEESVQPEAYGPLGRD